MAILPITSLLAGSSSPFLASGDLLVMVDISDLTQSVNGSTVKATTTQYFAQLPVPVAILSTSATAFAVGRLGATTPGFLVDASTATCVTGLKITSKAAASGVALVVISSGTNENLTVDAKGSGTIIFAGTSTGAMTFTTASTFSSTITVTGAAVFNGQYNSAVHTLTDGATIALDWADANVQKVTLGGNRTFTFANPVAGGRYVIDLIQDGTGSRTITWPTIKWAGGAAPILTTTASKKDVIGLIYDGVDYLGSAVLNF